MGIAFFLVAFAVVLLATFRSLGWGLLAVVAVGYFNGVIRANFLGVFSTFMFDAAVLGLYLGFFFRKSLMGRRVEAGLAGPFVLFLIVWPSLPVLLPHQPLLGPVCRTSGHHLVSSGLVDRHPTHHGRPGGAGPRTGVLNLVALAGGVYIFLYGVEALYPKNAITQIIYASNDVGRLQVSSRPVHVPERPCVRRDHAVHPAVPPRPGGWGKGPAGWTGCLAVAGVVAAAGGLLMCGARSPLVMFGLTLVVAWVLTR